MNPTLINAVASGAERVRSAIAQASARTGVDFAYLYRQAKIESGLDANARASTSSATGLYQFIDQSWLGALKRHGAKHGLGWAADCISTTANGRLCVRDPALRTAVMQLRQQPEASALMAAETAADNRAMIERVTGRPANATDLYLGHFLGPRGAAEFLEAMRTDPNQRADRILPAAAGSNRPVFYAADGTPRSLGDIYARFARKMGGDPAPAAVAQDLNPSPAAPDTAPSIPLSLARALAENDGDTALAARMHRPRPEAARMAYLVLANLGA